MNKRNYKYKLLSAFFLYHSFANAHNFSICKIPVFAPDTVIAKKDTLKNVALGEVLIGAVRAEKKLPVTETTLSKTEIEKNYTGQEMPVMLARTPAVSWYSDGGNFTGYSYLRLRGIDQTRINFTLDGVPLNEPEDQGAYFSNYPDFLNSVRSIQVQRGVGVSTNGTASFAGSVNMESPAPSDSAYTELNANYGSYNSYRISPEFNTGIKNNCWFYGRFSAAASDGFREHSGTSGQSFFLSGGYLMKRGMFKFTSFTGSSKNQMAYLAVPDSLLKINYRANLLTKDEKDEFRQSLSMLQYIVPVGRHSFLAASVYYTYLQGGYSILFAPDLYNYSVKSDFYGGIINYQFQKNALKINAGVHANNYVRYHYSSLEPYESVLLYKNAGHKNEFSSFLKAAYELGKFTVYADLQYRVTQFSYDGDKNNPVTMPSQSWQFFNPKGGISYTINDKHVLYVSAGKTSREPTRNDLFAGYDNLDPFAYAEIQNHRVKPESVLDFEAGLKLAFGKLKLDLNVYDMEFKNEIAAIGQLSYIGLPLRKNVASSYRRGIELSMIAEPVRRLIFTTQLNASMNRISEYTTDYDSVTYKNVQPLLTPQLMINQSVSYGFAKWLNAGADVRYVSSSFLDNTNNDQFVVPSSFILNASLGFTFLNHQSISIMVNNILDQQYYSAGYVQSAQPYYFAMAGRNYAVSLKLCF